VIPARPTTYNGIKMRSRLEAKYAAILDETGATWVYEPRAFATQRGQYLPDFQILAYREGPVDRPIYIEARPTIERAYLAMTQMPIIWESEPDAELIISVWGGPQFVAWSDDRKWILL
jgi:hypothetical protein